MRRDAAVRADPSHLGFMTATSPEQRANDLVTQAALGGDTSQLIDSDPDPRATLTCAVGLAAGIVQARRSGGIDLDSVAGALVHLSITIWPPEPRRPGDPPDMPRYGAVGSQLVLHEDVNAAEARDWVLSHLPKPIGT